MSSALLAALLSGCVGTPSVQFYVLEPTHQAALPSVLAGTTRQRIIGVGPVSVPALLERKQLITRSSDNTVNIAEFQQWASPLQDNLLQTLARNLSTLQPSQIIRAYPWSVHGTVDLQIIVDIIRFDTTPGESANLEANWTIKTEGSRETLRTGHTVINHSLADSSYPGSVQALSKILGAFSQELALALMKVEMAH